MITQSSPIHYGLIDPKIAVTMSGMELVEAIIAGRLPAPPIARTLNYGLVETEPGRAVFRRHAFNRPLQSAGSVHGGYTAGQRHGLRHPFETSGRQSYTTLEFKVNCARPSSTTRVKAAPKARSSTWASAARPPTESFGRRR